jgi:hypothetical protein
MIQLVLMHLSECSHCGQSNITWLTRVQNVEHPVHDHPFCQLRIALRTKRNTDSWVGDFSLL